MALRSISLFAGVGGLDLGLERAGIARTVCRVERDLYPAAVLAARAREGALCDAPVWSDVRTFDARQWRGAVDLVFGGFPCQPVSQIGQRAAQDDGRWLWPDFLRVVRESGAGAVFVENVTGLLAVGFGDVLGDLADLGLDAEWCVLGADAAGAPHQRDRVFLLAVADAMRDRLEGVVEAGAAPRSTLGGDAREGAGTVDAVPVLRRDVVHAASLARLRLPVSSGRGMGDGPVFPPGMDDASGWAEWLADDGPEPCLCRGTDGMADRLDRLRATGNGVVPGQAALAFRVLAERLRG